MGMVSGVLVLMGFAKVGSFHDLWTVFVGPCFPTGTHVMNIRPFFWTVFLSRFPTGTNVMKMRNEHVRISVFRAENDTK